MRDLDMSEPPAAATQRLSPRQKQCLRLIYDRRTSKEIAAEIGIAIGTVNTYTTEAIAILSARNRRHAAEILHEEEGRNPAPEKVKPDPEGVPDAAPPAAVTGPGSGDWRRLLPFRYNGVSGNDLHILLRITWPVLIAILLAIGFGMLATGVRVVSDILRALR